MFDNIVSKDRKAVAQFNSFNNQKHHDIMINNWLVATRQQKEAAEVPVKPTKRGLISARVN